MKKWRCIVCGYIHEGDTPPEECPICGVGSDKFKLMEEVVDAVSPEEKNRLQTLLFNVTYGLYVVTACEGNKLNGMISNTFLQVTDTPLRGSVCINKGTKTAEMIKNTGKFGVSILGQENHNLVKTFGYQSGHVVEKFKDVSYITGEKTGCPSLPGTLCFIELEVEQAIDIGTHFMFIGKVVGGEKMAEGTPMTYAYYRATR